MPGSRMRDLCTRVVRSESDIPYELLLAAPFDMELHSPDGAINAALEKGNSVVFMDVAIGGRSFGRLMIELFRSVCPKTCENFRQLCSGEFKKSAQPVGYKGSTFHRIIKGFMIQGGDFVNSDGTGSFSIYGQSFADEDFSISHDSAGLLSMANSGADTNGCQFFITCKPCTHLDGKHVVFGRLLGDASTVVMRAVESVSTNSECPTLPVTIEQCGEL